MMFNCPAREIGTINVKVTIVNSFDDFLEVVYRRQTVTSWRTSILQDPQEIVSKSYIFSAI